MVLKPGYLENKGALFESFGELGVTLSLQSSLSFRYGHVCPVFIMRFRQQYPNHVSTQFNLHPVSSNWRFSHQSLSLFPKKKTRNLLFHQKMLISPLIPIFPKWINFKLSVFCCEYASEQITQVQRYTCNMTTPSCNVSS